MRKLLISKINLIGIRFGQLFGHLQIITIKNNRNTHKLVVKYDVTVTKLSCLIVFIVICTDNFWKADGTGAILQQPNHIVNLFQLVRNGTVNTTIVVRSRLLGQELYFHSATSVIFLPCVICLDYIIANLYTDKYPVLVVVIRSMPFSPTNSVEIGASECIQHECATMQQ